MTLATPWPEMQVMRRYNVIIATDIGTFIVNKNDLGVGWQLSARGTYDPDELKLLRSMLRNLRKLRPNLLVMDIGANIGVHSVVLADEVGPGGKIIALEAQRIVFNMLAGNIALNSIENVHCLHLAASAAPGFIDIPQFDYGKPLSFGSVEFGAEQREAIGQERRHAPDRQEQVECVTVDSFGLAQLDLMKIDVEGMELDVLAGARAAISKYRPILFIEYIKCDRAALRQWLQAAGYRRYVFAHNYLCLPQESPLAITGLTEEQ